MLELSLYVLASEVGGHDDYRVLEVHRTSLVVGKTAVVEHLQQDVEHVGMGLLDFIEQHDGVRFAPDCFRKLASLVVSDVSRRRSDES